MRSWHFSDLFSEMISGRESDIDVLVSLRSSTGYPRITEILDMENELLDILGRKVDLVFRTDVESSRNYIRREAVLRSRRGFLRDGLLKKIFLFAPQTLEIPICVSVSG